MMQQEKQTTANNMKNSDNANNKPARQQRLKRRPLIGAIDQGTSSTRFLVFESGTGRLLESSQIEIQRIVPKEGWVEIDPNAIMASVYATIGEVHEQLASSGQSAKLNCIGICNQRESTVVWDKNTGKALYNVIVWMDNRTKDLVDNMLDSVPGRDFNWLKHKTGLPMSTYFSAFKLKWLIDNVAEVKDALDENRLLFGTVDSWILWNLTGKHLTDVTNASRTFLMDIETLEWDPSLCKYFKVPKKILPKILSSADDFGTVQHGPLKGLPITGVIGDQSAALFGHNCIRLGQTKATFGTGCFIMQNIGPGPLNGALSGVQRETKRGLITTVGYKLRDRPASYALEGSIKIAGAALTWLRDNMQLIENYEECDQLVNKTSHSAGVFFVPALGGLYSPYWDPNAAGLYIGLSQFTRREHLVRATFDSVAFQTNDILSLMRGVANGLMIDGGLCKSDNLCQILADITGCDIVRPSMCETSALGAAMVAGCGANIWTFEKMLANSSQTANGFSNQNHHYPHESLYYDEKFSSLIQSRANSKDKQQQHQSRSESNCCLGKKQQFVSRRNERIAINNRLTPCYLHAGGGVNDDAGGGSTSYELDDDNNENEYEDDIVDTASSQINSDIEEYEIGVTTSGEYTATSSQLPEILDSCDQIQSLEPTVDNRAEEEINHNLHHHQKTSHQRFYATPSSGYSSGDNELVPISVGGLLCCPCDPTRRQDSPISSALIAESLSTTNEQVADDCDYQSSSKASSTDGGRNSPSQQPQQQQQQQFKSVNREHKQHQQASNDFDNTHEANCNSKRSSFISQTFPSNLSTCLRTFICPPETAAAVAECMHDELAREMCGSGHLGVEEDYDQEPLSLMEPRPLSQVGRCSSCAILPKPVDIFQSYISLEHRTDLVESWRRAVERSMQWTKIHHEEVRRIDYQRLSSLPISIYLFFSIGMVALSGLMSGGHGFLAK